MSVLLWVIAGLIGAAVLYWIFSVSVILGMFKLLYELDKEQENDYPD